MTEFRNHRIMDMLKAVYPTKTPFCRGIKMCIKKITGWTNLLKRCLVTILITFYRNVFIKCKRCRTWSEAKSLLGFLYPLKWWNQSCNINSLPSMCGEIKGYTETLLSCSNIISVKLVTFFNCAESCILKLKKLIN